MSVRSGIIAGPPSAGISPVFTEPVTVGEAGSGINGISAGTNVDSSMTLATVVSNSGTVTSSVVGWPVSSLIVVTVCVCSGIVIVAPCILDCNPPSAVDIVKASGSGEAKKFCKPLRAKTGGNAAENPLRKLKSCEKSWTAEAGSFDTDSGIPSGCVALPVVTFIVVSWRSSLISAEALANTFTVVVTGVSTILALTFSSGSIVGVL